MTRGRILAGCLTAAAASLACAPGAGAADIDEAMLDLGSGPSLTTQVVLASGEDLTMTDEVSSATYALSSGSWGIGPDQTCTPDPPGAAMAIACERQTDPLLIDGQSGPHSISYRLDTDPFLFTVAQLSAGADGWSSLNPNPERIVAGDGPDTIIDQAGTDEIRLGPGADSVFSRDGVSDTIDCTGGGADMGVVDTSPAETFIACPDSDGDALADLADACPTQSGGVNGCPALTAVPTPPAAVSKRCKKKQKRGKKRAAPAKKKRCRKKR